MDDPGSSIDGVAPIQSYVRIVKFRWVFIFVDYEPNGTELFQSDDPLVGGAFILTLIVSHNPRTINRYWVMLQLNMKLFPIIFSSCVFSVRFFMYYILLKCIPPVVSVAMPSRD